MSFELRFSAAMQVEGGHAIVDGHEASAVIYHLN
jgi:hypothetical protein